MTPPEGSIWGPFGVIWGPFGVIWGRFGVIWGRSQDRGVKSQISDARSKISDVRSEVKISDLRSQISDVRSEVRSQIWDLGSRGRFGPIWGHLGSSRDMSDLGSFLAPKKVTFGPFLAKMAKTRFSPFSLIWPKRAYRVK